jgi:FixJ family two-component response regulator
VVDDDNRIRESLESFLNAADFRTAVFSSAEGALESGLLTQSSCLITDLRLQGIQGLDFQRRVKLACPNLPVIVISGHLDEEINRCAISAGVSTVLSKPLDPDVLLRAIHAEIMRGPRAI